MNNNIYNLSDEDIRSFFFKNELCDIIITDIENENENNRICINYNFIDRSGFGSRYVYMDTINDLLMKKRNNKINIILNE